VTALVLDDLEALVGQSLGESAWIEIDQDMIATFGRVTRDEQWIHVDPERAAAGPFGVAIAHGYLTLSLCSAFLDDCLTVTDAAMTVNYGLDRVRFPAPVPVGCRLRGTAHLVSLEPLPSGVQAVVRMTIENDGGEKPVCVADMVIRFIR